jgi:prefoldin subunit 5
MDYITGEIEYLQKELTQLQPLKRKTKNLKDVVVKHYCLSNDLVPEEQTLETLGLNAEDVDSMTKSFMHIENTFREKYRNAVEKRLNNLEGALEKLYET